MTPTLVIRHRKENLKKCSLRGLEQRADFHFFSYPLKTSLPPLDHYVMLAFDAPLLSLSDATSGLLVLDGTWRYAEKMANALPTLPKRSLPLLTTAYPRRQEDCSESARGLASIEAIYAAYHILGRDATGLLDNYHWKDLFLRANVGMIC